MRGVRRWLPDLGELLSVPAGIGLLLFGLNAVLPALGLHGPAATVIGSLLVCVAVPWLFGWAIRLFERRPAVELGLPALPWLLPGVGLGATLFSLVLSILFCAGVARLAHGGAGPAVAGMLAAACVSGVLEEIVFRGLLFTMVARRVGPVAGLCVSSLLFAAAHLGNGGGLSPGAMAGVAAAGLLLGAARMAGRCLWLPIGVHAGWNGAEGALFGADVSGFQAHGLLATALQGPVWMTGGRFGAEAGLPSVAVCLAGATALLALARRRARAGATGQRPPAHPEPVRS